MNYTLSSDGIDGYLLGSTMRYDYAYGSVVARGIDAVYRSAIVGPQFIRRWEFVAPNLKEGMWHMRCEIKNDGGHV